MLVFAAVAIWGDSERGVEALLQTQSEVARIEREIEEARQVRDARAAEVDGLDKDPAAIEAAAREDLGMVFPGESVVPIPEGERFLESPAK